MKRVCMAAGLMAAALAGPARAFINPNFTLIDLYRESEQILVVDFERITEDGKMTGAVVEVLKGTDTPKDVTIDVLGAMDGPQQQAILEVVRMGHKRGVIFTGTYEGAGDSDAGDDGKPEAFLNLSYLPSSTWQWVTLRKFEGALEVIKPDAFYMGTFSGGTDKAIEALRYFKADPEPELPVDSGVAWNAEIRAGQVGGRVTGMAAVDLAGDGSSQLFIASESGDRLRVWNGQGFDDHTARRGLAGTSLRFAFGDFTGDGRADLASWNGTKLVVFGQNADGVFAALPIDAGDAVRDCLGLAAIDAGAGRASLLISTAAAPLLATVHANEAWTIVPLPAGATEGAGEAAACLAADLDGDGIVDILRLFSDGSLFYRGQAPGRFADPVPCAAGKGRGRYAAGLGDFDHNGLPDIFTVAEDGNRLWQNEGGGRFNQQIDLSGEVPYIAKPEGIACAVADFNNDGRQDLFIAYAGLLPHLFFNRGFRSFGHARDVDLGVQNLLPKAMEGQQAGGLGDFNGDGAIDMALVLQDGEVWVFPRHVEDRALSVTAFLPAGGPTAGPVTVTAKRFDRSLGAMVVSPGGAGALFGVRVPGPIEIAWRFPGGEVRTAEVILDDGPRRFDVGAGK